MLPDIDEFVPPSACDQALYKYTHIYPDGKFSVVVVPSNEGILHSVIPHAHGHVIGAGKQDAFSVR